MYIYLYLQLWLCYQTSRFLLNITEKYTCIHRSQKKPGKEAPGPYSELFAVIREKISSDILERGRTE